jgi:hypothetical protein
MSARFRLRRFLYLEGKLTEDFLSQTGVDIYAEEAQTLTSEDATKRGGGFGAVGLRADASSNRGEKVTASRNVRLTPDSLFTRLFDQLEAEDAVQYLEVLDDDIWQDLRRGDVVELECNISVPIMVQAGVLLQAQPITDIAAAFGQELNPETQKVMEQFAAFISMLRVLPVICELAGAPRFKFVAPINPSALRVTLDDLSGEATIFATIDKKLKGREKWSLIDAIGLGSIPRNSRRSFDRDLGKSDALKDFTVTAPAAVLSPIAIYR